MFADVINVEVFVLLRFVLRSQFHQPFTHPFFVRKQIEQLSIVTFQLFYFWRTNTDAKCTRKMLMKLTPGSFLQELCGNTNNQERETICFNLQ